MVEGNFGVFAAGAVLSLLFLNVNRFNFSC